MGITAGSRLGPYLVEDRIASSGSGEWFAASDASLERPVSVLVTPLPADEESASALRDRARRLAGVTDARLLPVYGQGEDGAQLWLATRRTSGQSLDGVDRLERHRAARIGVQIADQLAALQDAGVAPDEIGPADIVLEAAGGGERAWLLPNPLRPQEPNASGASTSLVRLLDERTGEPLLADPQLEPRALVAQLAPFGVERSRFWRSRPRSLRSSSFGARRPPATPTRRSPVRLSASRSTRASQGSSRVITTFGR